MKNPVKARLALLSAALVLTACETLDTGLKKADQAIKIGRSGTVQTLGTIARASDPKQTAAELAKQRAEGYKRDPQALMRDIRAVQADYNRLVSFLGGNVRKTWGGKETKLPSRKQYIKYTQNYKSRTIVDFDLGRVTVETLDDAKPSESLQSAIVTTLLTPDDPRAVDLFSDEPVKLTGEKEPYLAGLVVDQNNRPITDPAEAEAFASHLLASARERTVDTGGGSKHALYVEFPMVRNFQDKQAEKYADVVRRHAETYKVSPSLIYAIIKTESNFNPFAVSSAPAYGMMQLVPTSGGREAYRRAKGTDEIPSKDYLFDAQNNIELGTAYLGLLTHDQLEPVANTVGREYCVIAAYNTGPGNVLRTFARDRVDAVNKINSLHPAQLYQELRAKLPYAETRDYLVKVVNARRLFVGRDEVAGVERALSQ